MRLRCARGRCRDRILGEIVSQVGAARVTLAVLAALAVPVAVFLGQAAASALPGSHWLKSDAVVLVIALAAIAYGIGVLSRGAHLG